MIRMIDTYLFAVLNLYYSSINSTGSSELFSFGVFVQPILKADKERARTTAALPLVLLMQVPVRIGAVYWHCGMPM